VDTFAQINCKISLATIEKSATLTKADLCPQECGHYEGLQSLKRPVLWKYLLRILKTSFIGGFDLLLSGFGKFISTEKGAIKGSNPQAGGELMLEARRVVTFGPTGILKKMLNCSLYQRHTPHPCIYQFFSISKDNHQEF
jgi:integration host factor subunit alpha